MTCIIMGFWICMSTLKLVPKYPAPFDVWIKVSIRTLTATVTSNLMQKIYIFKQCLVSKAVYLVFDSYFDRCSIIQRYKRPLPGCRIRLRKMFEHRKLQFGLKVPHKINLCTDIMSQVTFITKANSTNKETVTENARQNMKKVGHIENKSLASKP